MKQYVCFVCGYLYDPAAGVLTSGVAPGTPWARLPGNWVCPRCGAAKAAFAPRETAAAPLPPENLSPLETAALCSGLARGCEKQYLPEQAALFTRLAEYFTSVAPRPDEAGFAELQSAAQADLDDAFPAAKAAAEAQGDRGAQRALVWGDKVTRIQKSLLARYQKQGEALLEGQNVYVCSICGFIAVGSAPPALCPVCKAPDWKFEKTQGR